MATLSTSLRNPLNFFILVLIGTALLTLNPVKSVRNLQNKQLTLQNINYTISTTPKDIESASKDWGNITKEAPAAVAYPSSVDDIVSLIKLANEKSFVKSFAARGCAHSVRGQATAKGGMVINMTSLNGKGSSGIVVSDDMSWVDVGGQQLWVDVLNATLEKGVSPVSWTDYLYLTVGGTLSNAGISGQTFRHGPQINNVLELDVVTGKGDLVTCSKNNSSELFYAVLGGLGQFGIITRARIVVQPAPKMVKWTRVLYSNFSSFTTDQEHLISIEDENVKVNFLEGQVLLDNGSPDLSFYPPSETSKVLDLLKQTGILYILEVAQYDSNNETSKLELSNSTFIFEKYVSYFDFLNRVRSEELVLAKLGLWDVPHPWLNLFIPKSGISAFNEGVFVNIIQKQNITKGPLIVYPMIRNKWDDKMSAVIPDDEVFYTIGLLNSAGIDNWQSFDDQNKQILDFCNNANITVKEYLPQFSNQNDWIKQFGSKWNIFKQRKSLFDPKFLLSPGQNIFPK